MCDWDLPDMSTLALERCTPSGSCVHTYQANPPTHVTYITCTYIRSCDIIYGWTDIKSTINY